MKALAPIHLIGIAVSLALFYQSSRLVRKRKESVLEFLMWTGFGAAILLLSVSRAVTIGNTLDYLEYALSLLGFKSGIIGILVLAILGLILLLFYTYTQMKSNRKNLERANQEIALIKYEMEREEED